MLGTLYTNESRDSWATVPGRKTVLTYNANNKPTQIDFYDGTNIVFSQILTYDANNNLISVECITA